MIAFLRNELSNKKHEGTEGNSLFFEQNILPAINFDYFQRRSPQ
jgi:hypothetical protein